MASDGPASATDLAIRRLRDQLGERVVTTAAVRSAHGRGEGLSDVLAPDAVVWAQSEADVVATIATCAEFRVPVIPFGAGTSLEGQVQALRGGITLDLTRMNRVLDVSAANLDCRVEPGVTREALNAHLRSDGLFFPLDPGANATLGGMAATRASGTNAVRYGTMRDVTLGLTVVTPDARVIRTGGGARKSSTGYDLTRLYVGSEGTLGVITELRLRVFGVPAAIAAATCQFTSLAGAVDAVTAVLQIGVPMARIELLDALQMRACVAYSKLQGFDPLPTLFLEFHGSEPAVADDIATVEALCAEHGGGELRFTLRTEERTALWQARHQAYWAARALTPGREMFSTDACVPISALAQCIAQAQDAARAEGLDCPIVGHVGDGNFHMLVPFDPASEAERHRADRLAHRIGEIALAHGGTISGEHGIGSHKLDLMRAEHGEAVSVMRAIKAALDPHDIMNPGKTIPTG